MRKLNLTLFMAGMLFLPALAQDRPVIHLWPGMVPGETEPKREPVVTDNNTNDITRITEITDPAMIVYRVSPEKNNGRAVVVCPGGGYQILAIDHEGLQVAEWLNSLGYTAFVLQYRVPKKQAGALQDIQRAIRIVRSRAAEWQLEPGKLGVMGFSAGGSLCARASTRYADSTYEPVDEADQLSARPDFTILIYPAYLDLGDNHSLTPELRVDKQTPPMFLFVAADDRYGNSTLVMGRALRDQNVPVEVHVLPYGGHGFGLRPGMRAAETWPKLAEAWLEELLAK